MDALLPLPAREQRLERLGAERPDVLVVGGGITGAGIALDLAARGLAVALVERGDWACATSSASSRLIHGGLRYLEQLELGLVRESCLERGLLLRNAPGLVWPERFTFPVRRGDAVGRAKLAAGLALYTLVSLPRALGLPRLVGRASVARNVPGIRAEGLRGGGTYLDAATDDARLTLAVVATAIGRGVNALSRVELEHVEGGASGVEARLRNVLDGSTHTLRARACVLAGGPFTDELRARNGLSTGWVRPTRGSHVLVPRERLPTDGAVIFPSAVDQRVMFLIPWPRYTVIGTTDLDAAPGQEVSATRAEVDYLLRSANALVDAGLGPDDVVATWAGLRPLLAPEDAGASPSARSREERVAREGALYTIAGGKLTGFRAMAESLGARLASDLGRGDRAARSPTRSLALRGAFARPAARPDWSRLSEDGFRPAEAVATAWTRRYAGLAPAVEEACGRAEEGRRPLDAETLLGEVDWAVRHEDCVAVEDFLFRRTDLGLGPADVAARALELVLERMARLGAWSAERRAAERAAAQAALARPQRWRGELQSSNP